MGFILWKWEMEIKIKSYTIFMLNLSGVTLINKIILVLIL